MANNNHKNKLKTEARVKTLAATSLIVGAMIFMSFAVVGGIFAGMLTKGVQDMVQPPKIQRQTKVKIASPQVKKTINLTQTKAGKTVASAKLNVESRATKLNNSLKAAASNNQLQIFSLFSDDAENFSNKIQKNAIKENDLTKWKNFFLGLVDNSFVPLLKAMQDSFVASCGESATEKPCFYEGQNGNIFTAMREFYFTDAQNFIDQTKDSINNVVYLKAAEGEPSLETAVAAIDDNIKPLRLKFQAIQADAGYYWVDNIEALIFSEEGFVKNYFIDEENANTVPIFMLTPLDRGVGLVKTKVDGASDWPSKCLVGKSIISGHLGNALTNLDKPRFLTNAAAAEIKFNTALTALDEINTDTDNSYPDIDAGTFLTIYGNAIKSFMAGLWAGSAVESEPGILQIMLNASDSVNPALQQAEDNFPVGTSGTDCKLWFTAKFLLEKPYIESMNDFLGSLNQLYAKIDALLEQMQAK